MICVRLEGGLGNQLFQYAAGRALAVRHGAELLLDDSALRGRSRRATPRQLELQRFRHVGRIASAAEARWLPLMRRLPRLSRVLGPWLTYVERGLMFNPAFETLSDSTYLVGYWQSPRYFEAIAARLCEELQPVEPMSARSIDVAHRIEGGESVAVHVRRGDYVTLQAAAALHGTLPIAYYVTAIARLREAVASPHFFVFSDEPEWCASNLPLHPEEATFVSHNTGPLAWQDLMLMSRCRHHVIANSSFSWWGAWLADRRSASPQRQVVAPARWFGGQAHDTRDRFPSHWTTIA
jgi:hypothetical protein